MCLRNDSLVIASRLLVKLLLLQKLRSLPPLCSPNVATVHRVGFRSAVAVQQGSHLTCLPGGVQLSALAMLGLATWAERYVENAPALELMEAAVPWIQRWLLPTRQSQRGCAASCPRPWALELAAWMQSWLSSSVTLRKCFCFAESQL